MTKFKTQAKILSTKNIDSVAVLQKITKAIYVMRSDVEPNLYRFGGIGIQCGKTNTAIRRLGQCAVIDKKGVPGSWHYVAVAQLPDATSADDVKRHEQALRKFLIQSDGIFESKRLPRKDSFRWSRPSDVQFGFCNAIADMRKNGI